MFRIVDIAALRRLIPSGAAAGILAGAPFAVAQVIQVGEHGAVTVYDTPAVFDTAGSTPIRLAASRARRGAQTIPKGDVSRISAAANAAELSPALVRAVAEQESGRRPGVVSSAGAVGEMQLMPATARALGVDARDSDQNYRGGAAYLRTLLARYDGDVVRALSAYNAGPGAVDRYGGTPPYRETQAYVAAVLERLSRQAERGGR